MGECLDQMTFVLEPIAYSFLEVCIELGQFVVGFGVGVLDEVDF